MSDGTFSGSIRIETDQVPISVVFSQKYTYQVDYYDNYNGLTTSKFDDPSIEFSKDKDGTAVIKVKSFKKFIYENSNSNRYIRLLIPSTVITGLNSSSTLPIKSPCPFSHLWSRRKVELTSKITRIKITNYLKICTTKPSRSHMKSAWR